MRNIGLLREISAIIRCLLRRSKRTHQFREAYGSARPWNQYLDRKMIKNNPEQKPLITRLYKFPLITNLSCERNKPSNTFKWLTGRNPVSIGETEINLSLKKYAEDVRKLLKSFNCQKDCFVVMSGFKKVGDIDTWHCLPVIKTDSKQETVTLLNKRDNKLKTYTFEELINNFKAVVGIKNI